MQTREFQLRGRAYPSGENPASVQALVPTIEDSSKQFPLPERYFREAHIQPHIHNCQIIVLEGQCRYEFTIFFKNHCRLAENPFLRRSNRRNWGGFVRGDIVILKTGVRKSFVNMRGRDSTVADFAVKQ